MKTKKNTSIIDKYKGSGKSLAAISKEIANKYKNRDSDLVEKESFKTELQALHDYQEQLRLQDQVQESINQYMCGGKIKYEDGGIIKDVNGNPIILNNMQPGQISYPNTWSDTLAIPETLNNDNLIAKPFASIGPPKPFNEQVDTLSTNIGDSIYEVPGSNKFSTPQDAPTNSDNTNTRDGSAYTPALVGQGLSTLLNAGILAQGYDKVRPVNNPYEGDIKRLMQERGIDTTQQRNQILSGYNAARQNLNNVRSANIRNALDANLLNITQDNLAQSKLQEQQINQGFKADLANSLNNLGQQRVQATTYADELTARNKGAWQSELSNLGANITEKKLNEVQNKMLSDILSNKYADVGLNADVATRLSQGKLTPDDITILKNKYGDKETENLIKAFEVK